MTSTKTPRLKLSQNKEKTDSIKVSSSTKKITDEKTKLLANTPRGYLAKTSVSDIYSDAKKRPGTTNKRPSSITQKPKLNQSQYSIKSTPNKAFGDSITASSLDKKKSVTSVKKTVSHPTVKRVSTAQISQKKEETKNATDKGLRQRQNTITLPPNEAKTSPSDFVDNNAEMKKLTQKLKANPKAYFIDLDEIDKTSKASTVMTKHDQATSSSEELSYEDDFESYESDFESYHSTSNESEVDNNIDGSHTSERDGGSESEFVLENKEERMLDSGSFELREAQKSGSKTKTNTMDGIQEHPHEKMVSLTDEGFQDMSTSSGICSVDNLERPMFINFNKARSNKKKRQNEMLQQRAKDLLNMMTLHQMSFALFEMQPIPYDLFMATYGRSNYQQIASQTFDDGINESVQTDDVYCNNKWTQCPINFSKNDIYLNLRNKSINQPKTDEDYLKKFTFMFQKQNVESKLEKNCDNAYKSNPLRIFLEQKDGAGSDAMLLYEDYECKLKNATFNTNRLKMFLKRVEGKVGNILTKNAGNTLTDIIQNAKLPFSKGYINLSCKSFGKVNTFVFSDTKSNLLLTIHDKIEGSEQYLLCLWDISDVDKKPLKILAAIENINLCRLRGNVDGVVIAALVDGSIHLWDLSENATILNDTINPSDDGGLSKGERESDKQNSELIDTDKTQSQYNFLRACAYTSSAYVMTDSLIADEIVGLELVNVQHSNHSFHGERKVIAQVCSLQRIGILTLWLIVQDRSKHAQHDIGKAYWSRIKLEKTQIIALSTYIDAEVTDDKLKTFNLTAAKRRLTVRRKSDVSLSRPPSSIKSVASKKRRNTELVEIWKSGVLCFDLKIVEGNGVTCYLVAKNCGEVLLCSKLGGLVKVRRIKVSDENSSITKLLVSKNVKYFLASTEIGSVHLGSLEDCQVLLTLDCRNSPQTPKHQESYNTDLSGKYMGITTRASTDDKNEDFYKRISIKSMLWSSSNPCRILMLSSQGVGSVWDLAYSDIHAKYTLDDVGYDMATSDGYLALLNKTGELEVHILNNDQRVKENLELFEKYVSLL